ncbi:hypothetical protein Misp01_59330 [Microtetraspora sp. NBRC 13810]|uniref:single-stranded DNA-binding protein n=1 Tax=Microtetraspora sp. NBRC 13810 TaxID=3030990 RepID=UPI0024A3EEFD|nr:single-stranded DNA-binding protein [Microtetraspora sp. NBRC 13810]GLW10805.1 hypothetical protein Misp01_59330 [Microtetraspora sp. NBRC 13810]
MNDIYVTLTGNVAAEPRQHTFSDGSRVTSLRVVTANRYFDKKSQEWRDGDRTFFAVRCWRGLGDNVAQSIRVGHPVVVQGRLRIREFGREGERRFMAEVEAGSVGHDLRWGVGTFTKPQRGTAPTFDAEIRDRLDEATEDWAHATARPAPPAAAEGAAAFPFEAPLPGGVEPSVSVAPPEEVPGADVVEMVSPLGDPAADSADNPATDPAADPAADPGPRPRRRTVRADRSGETLGERLAA